MLTNTHFISLKSGNFEFFFNDEPVTIGTPPNLNCSHDLEEYVLLKSR